MSEQKLEYTVVAQVYYNDEITKDNPGTCITGIKDLKTAVTALNQWLDDYAAKTNTTEHKTEDSRLYVDHAIYDESTDQWPTNGYLFGLQDGKRENYVILTVNMSTPYIPGMAFPNMPD